MDANHTMTALYSSEIIIDNAPAGQSSNGASFTGKWCNAKDAMAFGPTSLQSCGKQLDTYRWTPSIPALETMTSISGGWRIATAQPACLLPSVMLLLHAQP